MSADRQRIPRRAPSLERAARLAQRHGTVTQRTIADELHVSQQRASQLVYRLVALGVLALNPGSRPRVWRILAPIPSLTAPAPPRQHVPPPRVTTSDDLPGWLRGL